MKCDREDLLMRLDSVSAGLAVRDTVEQSYCFVFHDGRVITFNDEIACSVECDIGITGAVVAKPLLALLGRLSEDTIDISAAKDGGEIIIKGKRRKAGVTMESEIALPVGVVEAPEDWSEIDSSFGDAISMVQHCASSNANQFALTCVHMMSDFVESSDGIQCMRYAVNTGVSEECLVKRDSIKHVVGLGVTEVSETPTWIHFRNPGGLIISLRREFGDYVSTQNIFDVDGTRITLPGGLSEAVEKAQIFAADSADDNIVFVSLKNNQMCLSGLGAFGWYKELKKVTWPGDPLHFSITPQLLVDITNKANECVIAPGRLRVDGGKFLYITCLGEVE